MQIEQFVSRYVEIWNNPSQAEIAELFAPDAVHAIEIGVWRGHEEIEKRVFGAYEEFVQPGEYRFRPAGDTVRHNDTVKFTATMVRIATGCIEWTGTVFLVFDEDGRIKSDYQFTNDDAATRVAVNDFLRRKAQGEPVDGLFSGDPVDDRLDRLDTVHTVLFDRADAVVLGEEFALHLTVADNLITGWRLFRG